jgi:hypothetical protein
MGDQAQTPTVLVPDTASAAITPITINGASNPGLVTLRSDLTIFRCEDVSGGCVITFTKSIDGTHRTQGDMTVTLTTGQVKYVAIESARFKDMGSSGDAGKVRITIDNDAYIETMELP